MGIEIERKFLPKNGDWRKFAPDRAIIRQGYLAREGGNIVRVRTTSIEGGVISEMCVKGPKVDGKIPEHEFRIAHKLASALFQLCHWQIQKTRHYAYVGNYTFEIDEFSGDLAGLVVIEVELEAVGEVVELPYWIGKEITDNPRYNNAHLCEHGIPE